MAIKVFLADDHVIVRHGIRLLLEEEADMKVIGETGNGREAVTKARTLSPDVVIMDIEMPGLNGIETIQKIHENCDSCKVIILSMHSSSEYIRRALKSGARGYILKESAGKELVRSIRSVTSGRRYLSREITEKLIDIYIDLDQFAFTETISPLEKLSSREREILQLVVEGNSSVEIANIIYISKKTVETYRSRMMQKLEISDIPKLVKFAIRHGLTSLD